MAGHLGRNEAFLLVGLLVADADGRRLQVEVDTLLDALESRNAASATTAGGACSASPTPSASAACPPSSAR